MPSLISRAVFERRSSGSDALWNHNELETGVSLDVKLLEAHRPNVVISDNRVTMAIAARVMNIPLLGVRNFYTKLAETSYVPIPPWQHFSWWRDLPGAGWIFRIGYRLGLDSHFQGIQMLRDREGLPRVPSNFDLWTDGDEFIYVDPDALFLPDIFQPFDETEHFVGPTIWVAPEARESYPDWWDQLPQNKRIAFVSLGSSGSLDTLQNVITALAAEDFAIVLSTSGRPANLPADIPIFTAQMLHPIRMAQRAAIVVTNGGSPMGYAALRAGTPILCIPKNFEQALCSKTFQLAGFATVVDTLRAVSFSGVSLIRSAVREALQLVQSNAADTKE
jgi:UDP:flavonoid glycosyltransferase YjiC (YdhE family)